MGLLRRDDLITRLCRETGRWRIIRQDGDCYDLQSDDRGALRLISVRHRGDAQFVMFLASFPLRFPLDRTPSGLFARMLVRNISLKYGHWRMDLRGSMEAMPYLYSQWPLSIMTASFFDSVCRELTDEISGFHQELRDKFRGDMTRPAGHREAQTESVDIRFFGPVKEVLPPARRPPMLGGF